MSSSLFIPHFTYPTRRDAMGNYGQDIVLTLVGSDHYFAETGVRIPPQTVLGVFRRVLDGVEVLSKEGYPMGICANQKVASEELARLALRQVSTDRTIAKAA